MDFAANKAALLAHYLTLARIPGWKAHAWHQVKELAQRWPEFYGDMPDKLTEAMNEASRQG